MTTHSGKIATAIAKFSVGQDLVQDSCEKFENVKFCSNVQNLEKIAKKIGINFVSNIGQTPKSFFPISPMRKFHST